MTDLDTRRPEFTVAIRGYDRTQVDEYLDYLLRLVEDADDRVREAEADRIFVEHAGVGPRVTEIFALAEVEARELRARVSTESAEMLGEARTEAAAIVDAADRAARETRERVERDHAAMLAEFESERERIRLETEALELRRADAISELQRLRELLGQAAGIAGGVPGLDAGELAPSQLAGPTQETVELPAVAVGAHAHRS